jgi:hypothetical protein
MVGQEMAVLVLVLMQHYTSIAVFASVEAMPCCQSHGDTLTTAPPSRDRHHGGGNGVKQLYSVDLADNGAMRSLAEDLGMSATGDPSDPHQTIYSLAL